MSDVMERASTKFPKTVSACHVEIIQLRAALSAVDDRRDELEKAKGDARELRRELDIATGEIEALGFAVSERDTRIEDLEAEAEERTDPINAIDTFLFEVERPVGKFNFDVVHGPSCDRAILGLYKAAGRNP